MKRKILDLIDFEKVNTLLEGFNKSTGFVTAILDMDGNVLSKSGWRQICTEFHRINPESSKMCTISDTALANKMAKGEKYHFYKCLNGLVDVAVPVVINGEHIANLFSGQFFFEEPDRDFFSKQAEKYGFNPEIYLEALDKVPVVSKEKVLVAMDFLLNMTRMISDITFQKVEQMELNEAIQKNERILRLFIEHSPASIAMFDKHMQYMVVSNRYLADYNLGNQNLVGRSHYEVFPEITERWKAVHRRCLAGETVKEDEDFFPRANGTVYWVRWEICPWYETENQVGGIILFSEVITSQVEAREALVESQNYNRMLFEQSAIGLALTSLDGKLIDFNSTFADIIGRTIEETQELTYWDITPGKYHEQEQEQLQSLAKTGHYGPYEKEYIHKQGHLVPVRLQGLIIERNNQKYIWSSVEDISKRRQAEIDLEENEELLRLSTELANVAAWEYDFTTDSMTRSKNHDSLYGLEFQEKWKFETFVNVTHPDDREMSNSFIQKAVAPGGPDKYKFDFRVIYPDQSIHWLNVIGEVIKRNEQGEGFLVRGFIIDITDRKRAEEELKASEEKFKAVAEVSPLAIYSSSGPEQKAQFINPTFHKMFGYEREDVPTVGHWWIKAFPDENYRTKVINEWQTEIDLANKNNTDVNPYECFCTCKDGSEKIIAWSAKTIGEEFWAFGHDLTERVHAQAKIRESEANLLALINNTQDSIWSLDRDYNYIIFNKAYADIFFNHYGFELKKGMNAKSQLSPDELTFWSSMFDEVFAGNRKVFEFNYLIDGTMRYFQTSIQPITEGGLVTGASAMSVDITNVKLAEDKLRLSEEKFSNAFHSGPVGFSINRISDGKFLEVNESFLRMFEYNREEVVGHTSLEINMLTPEARATLIKAQIELGSMHNAELVTQLKSGKIINLLFSSKPITVKGEACHVTTMIDITDWKHAEKALQESEEKYRSIYDNSSVAILLTAPDGRILSANDFACQLFNRTEKEICEAGRAGLLDINDPRLAIILSDRKKFGRVKGELTFLKKDGTKFPCEVSSVVFQDREGNERTSMVVRDLSEQKAAEEALILSEMKFRMAFKTSPDAINITRLADGMYIEVNEGFSSMLGYSFAESVGKTSLEMNIWADPHDRERLVEGLKKHNRVYNLEAGFVKKDGTIITGLMSATTITLNQEPHLISITRDISKMKAAQVELQKSESRFRTAFENSAAGMCLISPGGRFLQANKKLCEIFGYSQHELLNLSFRQITYPDDLTISDNFVKKAMDKKSDLAHFEKRYVRKNGQIIWAKVSSSLLRDETGQPIYFITQIIDVTEHKKAEEALKDSEERYRRLLINLEAGIVVHAPDTSIVLNNHRASELLGLSDDQLKGKLAIDPEWKFLNENSEPLSVEKYPVNEIIATKKPLKTSILGVVRPAASNIVWLSVNGFPVLDDKKDLIEVVISFIEITEQINAGIEIRKLNQELEFRVAERTAQLQSANKELETFTYSVSHDLKAPLRGIDGYSKLLSDLYGKELSEEAQTFITTIRNSTQQMNVLIEDLLEYSRLERSLKRNEKIKINDLIKAITSLFKNELNAGKYALVADIPDIELIADEKGLTIAMRNLIENAIKFSHEKDNPVIEIGLEENALSWIIFVKDNGIGFDMKYHQRIFEIFQRLHRAEDFAGTGIGLAMVSKAMQRMNGRVWADSKPGIGSTFYIEIPKPE